MNDESPTFTSPFGYSIPVSEGTNELTVISTEVPTLLNDCRMLCIISIFFS